MKHTPVTLIATVTLGCVLALSVPLDARQAPPLDPCAGSTDTAYGLCTAYCVHLDCDRIVKKNSTAGCRDACQKINSHYLEIVGLPINCDPSSTRFTLQCTCSDGSMTCTASGFPPSVHLFLGIDLTQYGFGQNGVGDAITDSDGNAQFPVFDVSTYLEERDLSLGGVTMQVTNVAGTTLAEMIAPTCTPGPALACTCSDGILSCSGSGFDPGILVFLGIDLTPYAYGQNGVGPFGTTDANGNVQFEPFDLGSYLAARNLALSSVSMLVTNQPGTILALSQVPTCSGNVSLTTPRRGRGRT